MKRRDAAVSSGQRQTEVDGACGFVGRSGAACSAHYEGCQAQRGGDGRQADPWRASVARSAIQRGGVSDGSRRGETPSAA